MAYREPFANDEWYHCYTRGIERRSVFDESADYERFLEALYLCNDAHPMPAHTTRSAHHEIFARPRHSPLVSIGAYCLMPNHFHLLIKQDTEGGLTSFMRKLGTAYTMFYNKKNERVGNLLIKPFRAKHVRDDRYLRQVTKYIHLNPVELFERDWKSGNVKDFILLEKRLRDYRYSSLLDYNQVLRPQRSILHEAAMQWLHDDTSDIRMLLNDAAAYYAELPR